MLRSVKYCKPTVKQCVSINWPGTFSYIIQLSDVDVKLLEELIVKGVKAMAKTRVK